jgi:hypothetical protein
MLILLGSHALNYYEEYKIPKDMDLVGNYDEIISFAKSNGTIKSCYPIADGKKLVIKQEEGIIEAEIAWEGSVAEKLVNLIIEDQSTIQNNGFLIPSLDVLYLLKMSHRYLKNSPHFLKTMVDIKRMRKLGAKIRPEHVEFFKLREKSTYTYNHPNLNVTKETFFNGDNVNYIYDHDSIHEAVKHLDKPAYNYYKPDAKEVFCDKDLFFSVDEKIRLYGVLEEVYVLALERSQIPYGDVVSPKRSFNIALMKLATSISSGWFREFAWENYDKVQELYDENYVTKFAIALKNKSVTIISESLRPEGRSFF